ncbi:hypothetical protein FKR81_30470 [Lentzea tibetensis]|uniref:Uncharacterized protein n=1 Tax=Lentzea tibetensis TaxID=2591470 RepID=A0A563ELT2_9PSEU|nr:hypothetical protein [Lentzea tibetensis]TWP47992.1 hypothetical protein FKR81_30470 [Lentzea tibetensis]
MRADGVTDEKDLARAGELLQRRVDTDQLSGEVLRVLTQLVALRDSVDRLTARPTVDAALCELVIACRLVAFDPWLRTDPEPLPEPRDVGVIAPGDQAGILVVVDALDALQRVVNRHGDGQEYFDAMNNARQLWQAARWVQRARVQLAAGVS